MSKYPYNTVQWQRLRSLKLAVNPMCEPCEAAGRVTVSNTVDHNVAISEGGPAFPSLDELTSCCPSCHSIKTARGSEAGAVRTTRKVQPRKGCDANGNPLDPAHLWHASHSLQWTEQRARTNNGGRQAESNDREAEPLPPAGRLSGSLLGDSDRDGAAGNSDTVEPEKSLTADASRTAAPFARN